MYKEYNEKLKIAREEAGYTQKQVSEMLKISQVTLSRYEKGTREPSIEVLCKLIDFYEVRADWVLGTGKRDK